MSLVVVLAYMPLDSFKTPYEKRLLTKLMQILNDPTHPMRHYFDSRRSNRSGRFLLPKTNTNRHKASFLPSALTVFNENYNNFVSECVKTSAEDDDFQSLSMGERERERIFYDVELLSCYVCTIQFLVVLLL